MKKLLTALMLLVSTAVMAEAPQSGTEFSPTTQIIPTDNPAKIEVTELFWYGCPHCYALEPQLAAWVKSGGTLVMTAGAGTRNAYNKPMTILGVPEFE